MGWARYGTPLGDAGYAVDDTCHRDGCDERIDRGLAYLCGSEPGRESETGCGRWFCGAHLYGLPDAVEGILGGGMCEPCLDRWYDEHPGEREREEEALARRLAELR